MTCLDHLLYLRKSAFYGQHADTLLVEYCRLHRLNLKKHSTSREVLANAIFEGYWNTLEKRREAESVLINMGKLLMIGTTAWERRA